MKISAMQQSLAPGLPNGGKEYFGCGLRATQGECGRDVRVWPQSGGNEMSALAPLVGLSGQSLSDCLTIFDLRVRTHGADQGACPTGSEWRSPHYQAGT